MTFETYAAEWFDRRDFFGNAWKENRRVLKMYILPVIGSLELKDIDEKHIDEIFLNAICTLCRTQMRFGADILRSKTDTPKRCLKSYRQSAFRLYHDRIMLGYPLHDGIR